MAQFIGIEIGGTKLQVVLGGDDARVLRRWRGSVNRTEAGAGIRKQIESALGEFLNGEAVTAAGIGFGGPVDWRSGQIRCSHHVEGWSDFNLGAWLETLLNCPVRVDNDANVGALGEARRGAGQGANPVFYVTLGSGVGGGLVVDGRIYHGRSPGESEIGHLRCDRKGTILESRCSGWAVDRRIRENVATVPDSFLSRLVRELGGPEARHLAPALEQGDALAERMVAETAGELAFGLSHVVHLIHPERVVLGGGLSLVGEHFRRAVAAELPPFIMSAFQPGPAVVLSQLKEDAVPIGALEMARSVFASEWKPD